MSMQERCVEAYEKHKHLKNAAAEVGIPWQTLYVHLRKSGTAVTGDKKRYGSESNRIAARAEDLFEDLVPFAENQNAKRFQSKVDFMVLGNGVDVKAGRRRKSNGKFKGERWAFCIKKQEAIADFFVCFALGEDDALAHTLLVPGEIARKHTTISLSCSGAGKWWDYKVQPDDLSTFFTSVGVDESECVPAK